MQPIFLPWTTGKHAFIHSSRPTNMNLAIQFADNTSKVQKYKPGQVVNIVLDIENHHPVGYAVSFLLWFMIFTIQLINLPSRMSLW